MNTLFSNTPPATDRETSISQTLFPYDENKPVKDMGLFELLSAVRDRLALAYGESRGLTVIGLAIDSISALLQFMQELI